MNEQIFCSICYDTLDEMSEGTLMNCGHKLCGECIEEMLSSVIGKARCPLDQSLIQSILRFDMQSSTVINHCIVSIVCNYYNNWFDPIKIDLFEKIPKYLAEFSNQEELFETFSSNLAKRIVNEHTSDDIVTIDLLKLIQIMDNFNLIENDLQIDPHISSSVERYLHFIESQEICENKSEIILRLSSYLYLIENVHNSLFALIYLMKNITMIPILSEIDVKMEKLDMLKEYHKNVQQGYSFMKDHITGIRAAMFEIHESIDSIIPFISDRINICLTCDEAYNDQTSIYFENCQHILCNNCINHFLILNLKCPFNCQRTLENMYIVKTNERLPNVTNRYKTVFINKINDLFQSLEKLYSLSIRSHYVLRVNFKNELTKLKPDYSNLKSVLKIMVKSLDKEINNLGYQTIKVQGTLVIRYHFMKLPCENELNSWLKRNYGDLYPSVVDTITVFYNAFMHAVAMLREKLNTYFELYESELKFEIQNYGFKFSPFDDFNTTCNQIHDVLMLQKEYLEKIKYSEFKSSIENVTNVIHDFREELLKNLEMKILEDDYI